MKVYDDCGKHVEMDQAPGCVTVIVKKGESYSPTGVDAEVVLDYRKGRDRIAEKLRAYRARGEKWKVERPGCWWVSDSGDVLERFTIDRDDDDPGVYI